MPQGQPGAQDVHVDTLMSQISVGYRNEEYIAQGIFPVVMVEKQSDLIGGYDKGDFLRAVMQPYQPGTEGARSGYKVDKSRTYFCSGWKLGKVIPDDVVANADKPFNMFQDATAWLTEQGQLRWELEFAVDFFAASKGWQDRTGGTHFTKFSNLAGSNPITTCYREADLVRQKTGRRANTAVMSKQVWDYIRDHPLVVDRLKYTSKDSITPEMFARLIEVERVLIGSAIYVSSGEDVADVVAEIWGNHVLLAHVAPRPSLMMPTAGYTFIWRPITNTPVFFRRYRQDNLESTIQEIKSYFDMKQIDGDNGVFLANAV